MPTSPEIQLTAADALRLVSPFFESEWPQTSIEDVHMVKVTGGFCHRLHLLSRNNQSAEEPANILIRHFGPSGEIQEPRQSNTSLSATEQAVVYHEMGRRGWGPKIYGTFPGGRLEEYLQAHPLTADQSTRSSIRGDIARAYARLHSLQLPLRKNNFRRVIGEMKQGAQKSDEIAQKIMAASCTEATEFATIVRQTDWAFELDWVSGLFEKHDCKRAFAVGDTNFLNVLVKNYISECRVALIDYETVTYSYRGIDIGGHFTDRMYRWGHPESKLTGYSAPDADEQRSFCESYRAEMQSLGLELTAKDSEDHLLLEANIGRMYQILFSVLMGILFDELPNDPYLFAGLSHMMRVYHQLKQDFTEQH